MRAAILVSLALVSASAVAQDKKIERVWKAKCASCHGADGSGQTDTGKQMGILDLTSAALGDDQIRERIETGVAREKNGKQQDMKAFKEVLKPEEIDGLVAYVKALKK